MEVDVAVLGGRPGGCTSAIRAAQLGARVACIEREPELGGTCLRVGFIPTMAWVQTAFALKEVEETRWSVDGDRTVNRIAGELGRHLGALTTDEAQ
jgi:pyruvate/2-oxoglutarate dehydrogenase complex dihydrolipoamide dehydrogenase (E3) component